MDTHALRAALESALSQIGTAARPESPGSAVSVFAQETLIDHKHSEGVLRVLEQQEEFAEGRSLMINSGLGFFGFQSRFVATKLVSEARRRQSAEAAVRWLQKVLHAEKGEGLLVCTLWGANPSQSTRLLEDVDLLPFQSLPDSRQKEMMTTPSVPSSQGSPRIFGWNSPTAALVKRVEVRPFLLIEPFQEQAIATTNFNDGFAELNDTRLCLALTGPTALIPGPSWFQYVDPDLEAALLGPATSYSYQEVIPLIAPDAIELDLSGASDLVQAFMALEEKWKSRVRTALERLHLARVRMSPADQAVELSIALETLLGENGSEALGFKLGLRAALLTSDSLEDRLRTRAVIKAVYSIRGMLMHEGEALAGCQLKQGQPKTPSADITSEAAAITADVIRWVVTNGSTPLWNPFELSDGRTI